MYLAVSTNVDDVTPLLEAELDRLDELRDQGVLVDGWVKTDWSGAVLVLDCASEEGLNETLASFPTAVAGLTTFLTTPIVSLDSVRPTSG